MVDMDKSRKKPSRFSQKTSKKMKRLSRRRIHVNLQLQWSQLMLMKAIKRLLRTRVSILAISVSKWMKKDGVHVTSTGHSVNMNLNHKGKMDGDARVKTEFPLVSRKDSDHQ